MANLELEYGTDRLLLEDGTGLVLESYVFPTVFTELTLNIRPLGLTLNQREVNLSLNKRPLGLNLEPREVDLELNKRSLSLTLPGR